MKSSAKKHFCFILAFIILTTNLSAMTLFANSDSVPSYAATYPPNVGDLESSAHTEIQPLHMAAFATEVSSLDEATNVSTYAGDVHNLAGGIYTFNFTGGMQSISLPPGRYTLEVWGAQGGSETWSGFTSVGGRGGYSSGEFTFATEQTLYIGVGGAGGSNTHPVGSTVAVGGFNGGGRGCSIENNTGSGGGGATHIATAQGVLSGLNGNRASVLIVAGGGGGGDAFYGNGRVAPGAAGGGNEGENNGMPGSGGTQATGGVGSSNGSFGQGGHSARAGLAGGGGGWFGGAGGFFSAPITTGNIGAGGSGYIGGVTSGTTTSGVREGHGMARITLTGAGTDDSLLNLEEKDYDGELPREEGDPIDVVTGIFTWEYANLELHGAQNLTFSTHYASNLKCGTSIGTGWRHSFDYRLIVDAEQARLHLPNGNTHDFTHNGGIFVAQANSDVLLSTTTNGYQFTDFDMTHYDFDSTGNLVKIQDIRGNTTILTHEDDKLTQVSNRAGIMNFEYTEFNISKITDHTGRSVSFTYNPAGQLVSFENPDGQTFDFKYDATQNLTEINDFNGKTFLTNAYQNGKVIEQTLLDQGTMYFDYNPETFRTIFTDTANNVKVYHYDENQKITRIDDQGGVSSQIFEDGRLVSVTDFMGNTTSYTYDSDGNRTSIMYPDGLRESFEYNEKRQITKETLRNGTKKLYNYDNRGNLVIMTIVPERGQNRVYHFIYNGNNDLLTYTDATGAVTTFTYDNNGNRLSVTDATNRTTRYTYDDLGRLVTQISPMNEVTVFTYTLAGKLTSIIHPDGSETFEVNANGVNTRATDLMGFVTTTTYDSMSNPLTVTDPEGGKTSYVYDALGNLTQIADPMNASTMFVYDSSGRLTSTTDANNNTWKYKYDANGRLIETQAPDRGVSSLGYDNVGNIIHEKNELNATITYSYDNMGRVTMVTDALAGKELYEYDGFGNITSITDPNGNIWHYAYDNEDRLLESTDPLGGKTSFTYDASGRLLQTTSPAGVAYKYSYNGNGHVEKVTDLLGNTYTQTYDNMGRLTRRTNPDATYVSYAYDKNGRLTKATDEAGSTSSYTYDKNGNVLTITDASKHITRFTYDNNNRLTGVTDALGGMVGYTYDNNGNVKCLTDTNGNRSEWFYDNMNRPVEERRTGLGTLYFSYNQADELISLTNGRGVTLTFSYDANGNATSSAGINYTYDKSGNVLTVTNKNGTSTREYDALNRVIAYKDANGNTIKYNYDADGRVRTLTYPGNEVVTYTYNQAGQLTSVIDYNNRITSYQYDANGRLVRTETPDGLVETIVYVGGRMVNKRTVSNGEVINDYHYTHDANGNITRETNTVTGNEIILPEGSAIMTYDSGNRLATYNGKPLTYDADGNMTYGLMGDTFVSFAYDNVNTLVQAGDTAYVYDGENNRISQTISGQTTTYVTDPNAELSRLLVSNNPDGSKTLYVYGLGLISQEQVSQSTQKSDYRLFHYDYRGSTTVLTDVNGIVTDRIWYDPFGLKINQMGSTQTNFMYVGQHGVQSDFNGLIYMRTRYFNPAINRFINQDPYWHTGNMIYGHSDGGVPDISAIHQSSNLYSYAGNNPIKYIDTDGNRFFIPRIVPRTVPRTTPRVAPKVRNPRPIARRIYHGSRKQAYEAAKQAGKGAEPVQHVKGSKHNPDGPSHYHPNVKQAQRITPKNPTSHDHHYYPGSYFPSFYTEYPDYPWVAPPSSPYDESVEYVYGDEYEYEYDWFLPRPWSTSVPYV